MAGQFSTVGAHNALDAVTGRATQTARTTYLALLTAAPSDSTTMATMTEVTTPGSNGYSRQSVSWSTPSGESTSNSATVTFGPFTSDLGEVTHCALVSAASGTTGDLVAYWTLDTARDPADGDSISFAAGQLVLTCE